MISFTALKPLEDAEAETEKRIVLHKLPVRTGSNLARAQPMQLPQARSPQTFKQGRTGVIPPSLIRDLPLTQKHIDGRPLPPSSSSRAAQQHTLTGAVTRMAGAARAGALNRAAVGPSHPHEQTERLLEQNPDIRDLYSTGILPGSWQIQHGVSSVPDAAG